MNENVKLDMEVSDLNFEITPWGYKEDDAFICELKLTFETNSNNMIEMFKMYKKLSEISEKHLQEDENGDPFYQTDIWDLQLNFLKFEKDNE